MKRNIHLGSLIALMLFAAGILFVSLPRATAQAQENIANMNTPDASVSDPTASDMADMITADDSQDPPSRVARLSFTEGSVSLQPGGTGDWGTAAKNRPMTIGDKLWTDKDSRAELQAGQVAIHLGDMTALSFLNLDQNVTQMRLAEGHLNFRVREIRQGESFEVDTPNLAFTVKEAGAFRVDVNENGDSTSITVIRGKGEVAAGGQTYPLNAGERADITGTDNNVQYTAGSAAEPDGLDRWSQERNVKEDTSVSAQHVSRDVVGYSDLDDNGTWREEQDYGSVWVPNNVPAGWAPYSNGYWSYVSPWGYTWVDYAPWGFAPFHYGRWNYFGGYWGWCPGPYGRAFYGPAYVGFLGGGFGFGFGVGFHVGWFPLGWGEPFHPWYHYGPGYFHGVNVYNTHFANVNRVNVNNFHNFSNYRYAHNVNAVSSMPHSAFASGQAVNRGGTRLTAANLRGATVSRGGIGGTPNRGSYFGASNAAGHASAPSAGVQNRMGGATFAGNRGFNSPANPGARGNAGTQGSFGNRNNTARPNPSVGSPRATTPQSNQGFGSAHNNMMGMKPNTGNSGMSESRPSQLSANRPPSGAINSARSSQATGGRTWSAQGNSTDSGRAPQGFGSSNRPTSAGGANSAGRSYAGVNSANRPPWAGNGASVGNRGPSYSGGSARYTANRPAGSMNGGNRNFAPPSYGGNRSVGPSYGGSNRSYSSAPSYGGGRGYSAPSGGGSRGYSAPRSSGGGGSRGGGGGGPRGGGGSPHGGGGSHGGGGRH